MTPEYAEHLRQLVGDLNHREIVNAIRHAHDKDPVDYLLAFFNFAGLLVIAVTAWFTHEMRKAASVQAQAAMSAMHEAQLQNSGAVMPVVVLLRSTGKYQLPVLSNVGKGPALNVSVSIVDDDLNLVIEHDTLIAAGQSCEVSEFRINRRSDGAVITVASAEGIDGLTYAVERAFFPEQIELRIDCEAIDRQRCTTVVSGTLDGSGIRPLVKEFFSERKGSGGYDTSGTTTAS